MRGNLVNGDGKRQERRMTKMQDPSYLRGEQYRTADNLAARIRLHDSFSTNTYGWFRWIFDHFELPEGCRILELGCGPGDLWRENAGRIHSSWEIVLSDFSEGMVTEAQKNLAGCPQTSTFAVIDAQELPFGGDCFDAVIANHCLYHFPDLGKALSDALARLKKDRLNANLPTELAVKVDTNGKIEEVVRLEPSRGQGS